MRGMHIDQDQSVLILGKDIDAMELCDRKTQRWNLRWLLRELWLRHSARGRLPPPTRLSIAGEANWVSRRTPRRIDLIA